MAVRGNVTTEIYQIFYNEETRGALDPGFIPLDNSRSEHPDWLEFWVILNFLQTHELRDDRWYGFVSPKFSHKTGWDSKFVHDTVQRNDGKSDVVLFSPFIDELTIYQNTFEQCEWWHQGILATCQTAITKMGACYDAEKSVGTLYNSVFCNYVVARSSYWRNWRDLAVRLFDLAKHDVWGVAALNASSIHDQKSLPIKLFVQERLTSIILADGRFRTYVPPENLAFSRYEGAKREFLVTCEYLKQTYATSGDPYYLSAFKELRFAHYAHGFYLG